MADSADMGTLQESTSNPYSDLEDKSRFLPVDKKSRLLVWDSLGFSAIGILLLSSFSWIPSITFATYLFLAFTTFTLFGAGILLLWKSNQIGGSKAAVIGLFFNSLILSYVILSIMLGIIASYALTGVDFSQ